MSFEKRYYYRNSKKEIIGKLSPEKPENYNYLGYFGEIEIINWKSSGPQTLILCLEKDKYAEDFQYKKPPNVKVDGFSGYHGGGVNSNCIISLSKKDLLALAECMSDTDKLLIMDLEYSSESIDYLKECSHL